MAPISHHPRRRQNIAILFITITSLSLIPHAVSAEYDEVVYDHFLGLNPRSGSRFLKEKVKKGTNCDEGDKNICPGVPANNGTQLLTCCKKHCRDVRGDRNNCGQCGRKCRFGQLCCNGVCTVVAYDVTNCGECGNVCKSGVRCEYGSCGYA